MKRGRGRAVKRGRIWRNTCCNHVLHIWYQREHDRLHLRLAL